MSLVIDNSSARKLFLHRHGLGGNPGRKVDRSDILELIRSIGFVQVDSIRTVERAHHHILFSRLQTFRHKMLEDLLEKDRALFENWTHDASIIPIEYFPYWRHKFAANEVAIAARWKKWGREGFQEISSDIVGHISQNGPTFSRDLKPEGPPKSKPGWWDWHPQKTALEYLWRTGKVAICHRKNFQKAYDLAKRIVPPHHFEEQVSEEQFVEWAITSAHQHLGFATHGEIAAFWNLISPAVARNWLENNNHKLVQAEIMSHDNQSLKKVWVDPEINSQIEQLPDLSPRLRILSPFDPALRDRKRALFLFGFDYRIEIFVPEAKRKYGYYVFPMLEKDKIIGRIDMKADRKTSTLNIRKTWLEDKVKWSKGRKTALERELDRMRRFSNLEKIKFDPDAFG